MANQVRHNPERERYEIVVDLTNDVIGSALNLEAHNAGRRFGHRFRGL